MPRLSQSEQNARLPPKICKLAAMNDLAITPEQLLSDFHQHSPIGICISAAQGSRFAKTIAGDHNPIHDVDAPRFCVPGDLLFALIAGRYGLAGAMHIRFNGMLRADTPLCFPDDPNGAFDITDERGKAYVSVERSQPLAVAEPVISAFIQAYVACSGESFPGLLQPLLKAHDVMFNPERPLVVYDSMRIELARAPESAVELTLEDSALSVDGKRGDVRFDFAVSDNGRAIGRCAKKMVVSGLRPYDDTTMQALIDDYEARRRG